MMPSTNVWVDMKLLSANSVLISPELPESSDNSKQPIIIIFIIIIIIIIIIGGGDFISGFIGRFISRFL